MTDDLWREFNIETYNALATEISPELPEMAGELRIATDTIDEKLDVVSKEIAGKIGSVTADFLLLMIFGVWEMLKPILPDIYKLTGRAAAWQQAGAVEGLETERPLPLDVNAAVGLWYKMHEKRGLAENDLAKQGLSDDRIEATLQAAQNIPDITLIQQLYFRGYITPEQAKGYLRHCGYGDDDADLLFEIFFYVAPAQDVIRFAVREVYTPEIAERFGQFEDYPMAAEEDAQKAGIDPELLKKYWAAHWELPGLSSGYEMMQRLHPDFVSRYREKFENMGLSPDRVATTFNDLMLLLRSQDVMPFWREKLMAISYAPLTRVDIRRMYKLNVITIEDVYWCYRELGYDDMNSTRLTAFTQLEAVEAEKDLTKGEILTSYREKLLTEDMVRDYLSALKYSDDEIALLLALENVKIEKAVKTAKIKAIRTKYLKRVYDDQGVVRELSKLALTSAEIAAYTETWSIERMDVAQEITLKELQDAIGFGAITPEQFTVRLRLLGYGDEDITIIAETERLRRSKTK